MSYFYPSEGIYIPIEISSLVSLSETTDLCRFFEVMALVPLKAIRSYVHV